MSGTAMKKCFACGTLVNEGNYSINHLCNLPVCHQCKGTDKEKKAEKDALDSLGEGFTVGCIS
jgi:hypothetical protein